MSLWAVRCDATSEKQVIEVVRFPDGNATNMAGTAVEHEPADATIGPVRGDRPYRSGLRDFSGDSGGGALGTATYSAAAVHLRAENAAKVEVTATITATPVFVPRMSSGVAAYSVSDGRFGAMVSWNENGHSGQATTAVAGGAKAGDLIPLVLTARILDARRDATWAREWRLLSRPIGQDK